MLKDMFLNFYMKKIEKEYENEPEFRELWRKLANFFLNDKHLFVVTGRAGSGKSFTIAKLQKILCEYHRLVVENRKCPYVGPELVKINAFTNKAIFNLVKKGIRNVRTLHSEYYDTIVKYDRDFGYSPPLVTKKINFVYRGLRHAFPISYLLETEKTYLPVIIIDEASMIPSGLLSNLLKESETLKRETKNRINVKIILFGDRNQLPPVKEENCSHFFFDGKEDYILEKNYRNSCEKFSELEDIVLEGKTLPQGTFSENILINPRMSLDDLKKWFGGEHPKYICFSRESVRRMNKLVLSEISNESETKKSFFKNPHLYPRKGLRMVMEDLSIGENYNGMEFEIISKESDKEAEEKGYGWFKIRDENGKVRTILIDTFHIALKYGCIDEHTKREIIRKRSLQHSKNQFFLEKSVKCDYAYAITCHKAQGCEWENICVMCDMPYYLRKKKVYGIDYGTRWLYTAITRTRGKLAIFYD